MQEPLLETYFDRSLDVLLSAGATAINRLPSLTTGDGRVEMRAIMTFPGPSYLNIRLVAIVSNDTPLLDKYSFQYMAADGATIFRYDNSDYHPGLPHAPHHKHEGADERVIGCPQPSCQRDTRRDCSLLEGLELNMPSNDKSVEFATYPNEMEAQMVAQLLRDNGVGAFVQPLGFGYGGVGTFQFIPHRVLVYEHNMERAQEILHAEADWEEVE